MNELNQWTPVPAVERSRAVNAIL